MAHNNPYAGASMVLKNGDPLEELRFGKSAEKALSSSTGEVNAYNKKDLLNAITRLMNEVESGNVIQSSMFSSRSSAERTRELQERREVLMAAHTDPTGQAWAALGSSLATQINEQASREGFMRRLLLGNTLRQGEIARVSMPTHDTFAVVATSSSNVGYQIVRGRMFQPDEFEVIANVRVELMDIEQVHGDLLEYAYNEGIASIMVKEDVLWKRAADMTVGIFNPLIYVAGELTPELLSRGRQQIAGWNLPVTTALISNDYWTDITANSDFSTLMDPITKYDLILNGYIGTMLGMTLVTDAFRPPNQKVLLPGEIYILSTPEFMGAYSDRGGVRSTPTSGADAGSSNRGWLLSEIISMLLSNQKAVCKLVRL